MLRQAQHDNLEKEVQNRNELQNRTDLQLLRRRPRHLLR